MTTTTTGRPTTSCFAKHRGPGRLQRASCARGWTRSSPGVILRRRTTGGPRRSPWAAFVVPRESRSDFDFMSGAQPRLRVSVMRVLVVEDDKKIASFVSRGLKEAGYAVDVADRGDDGLHVGLNNGYDVAVVDLMLPGLDGLNVIERWRAQKVKMPVLILSAKRSVDDRVKGLQAGSDDYLTKPFAFSELLARIQALVRRATQTAEPTSLTYADLTVDLLSREVTRGGRKIELQAREFSLLEYLLRNAGRVVSKTMILEHVWDYAFDPKTNVIDVLVSRLRSKIDRDFDRKLIHTMRGFGYVLKAR